MDFLQDLKSDHAKFRAALDRLERLSSDASPSRAREAAGILDGLLAQMRSHQDQERKRLFPAIRQRAPGSAPLLDAMAREHSRLEQLLCQTRSFVPSAARRSAHRFTAALRAFDEALRAHIRREETEIFSLARTGFTPEELEGLAQAAESREFPEFADLGGGD